MPFGLQPYKGDQFQRLHAAGSRVVTASGVPAIFGVSRWASARSYAEHLLGRVPHEIHETDLMTLGKDLQGVALVRASRLTGLEFRELHHFRRHPTIERFIASPDGYVLRGRQVIGIAEVKLVTPDRFLTAWADGPPVDVRLQVQAQIACTRAPAAWIVAMLPRMRGAWFDLEVVVYEEAPNSQLDLFEQHVADFIADLDRGTLPPLDHSEHSARVVNALYRIDQTKTVELGAAAHEYYDAWRQGQDMVSRGKKMIKKAQNWFVTTAPDAHTILVQDRGTITVSESELPERTMPSTRFRRFKITDWEGP